MNVDPVHQRAREILPAIVVGICAPEHLQRARRAEISITGIDSYWCKPECTSRGQTSRTMRSQDGFVPPSAGRTRKTPRSNSGSSSRNKKIPRCARLTLARLWHRAAAPISPALAYGVMRRFVRTFGDQPPARPVAPRPSDLRYPRSPFKFQRRQDRRQTLLWLPFCPNRRADK